MNASSTNSPGSDDGFLGASAGATVVVAELLGMATLPELAEPRSTGPLIRCSLLDRLCRDWTRLLR